jgi:hypothetical protein
MRGLSRHDPYGEGLAICAIAAFPALDEAKGFMARLGYEVSIRALETVRRHNGPEIEEAREKLAVQQREREWALMDSVVAERLAESQN